MGDGIMERKMNKHDLLWKLTNYIYMNNENACRCLACPIHETCNRKDECCSDVKKIKETLLKQYNWWE